ncbi:hypothetical protein MYCTH_2297760 [Thermothelomyces thermophilus ATCC 42464]|uniref:Uncharacterized protein n=1 Tax=Thermothelomyces thermophilus (strain ATCC 42464 / BCRC 31852 / DSM 1799) TaxID=573729 RepID=G2Q6Y9_THET4|nr:uncharacterized protein MYCTH_2297760 [Thermothelomyces thermophilus ATCC 42464]AEO54769.1 hypothetical protein MYCTH_2297760 [Thermothelomyces thermophilus ATCC 42464]
MATSIADEGPGLARESFSAEDFETASVRSIRSAAPSYTSDAPSYHTINPHPEPLPPYSPPARPNPTPATASRPTPAPRNGSVSSLLDLEPFQSSTTSSSSSSSSTASSSNSSTPRRYGLPPVPPGPPRPPPAELPSLAHFRTPTWSSAGGGASNPTARIYQNVALRRASAASSSSDNSSSRNGRGSHLERAMLRRVMLERIDEEERNSLNRVRPLEDPYLVGEEAAARARAERLARERNLGDEILIREDRRWDWFLAQMRDREERERNWKRFRKDIEKRTNSRLPFRIGARF